MKVSFSRLKTGQCARVVGFGQTSPAYRHQLISMGLTCGTILRVLRIAPFGDPVQIEVRGSALCLRKQEADTLALEFCDAD